MKARSSQKEQLDNLSLNGEQLHKALQSLAWVNRWLGNYRSVINAILSICKQQKETVRITDLGCGGGDLIVAVAKALQKNNIPFFITGIDGNENTLQYAREKCSDFATIKFIKADILNADFTIEPCDILMTSHFIYHFTEDGLVHFINNNMPNIGTAFVCSELERSRLAISLFKISNFFLPLSKLAKEDGVLAIKRALTKKEWLSVLQKANITKFILKRVPLFRIQLVVFKPSSHQARK